MDATTPSTRYDKALPPKDEIFPFTNSKEKIETYDENKKKI